MSWRSAVVISLRSWIAIVCLALITTGSSACEDDECTGEALSCAPPVDIAWPDAPSTPPPARVCVNERCGDVMRRWSLRGTNAAGESIRGIEVDDADLVDDADEWHVRLELLDDAGVTIRSLSGAAEVAEGGCGGCRAVQLTVSPDGTSLIEGQEL